jgi:hypothetical protein
VSIRRIAAVFAVFAVLVAGGSYVVWRQFSDGLKLALPQPTACTVTGGSGTASPSVTADPIVLDPAQLANAATIGAVGIRRKMPDKAIVIAIATAWQESKLINLPGGDRDSIGLFQQRPSQGWGKPEQLADPRYAAGAFYTSLTKVHGWQDMRVTDAAQAVQHSAHPGAYEKWTANAEQLARAFTGEVPGAVSCTLEGTPASRGPVAAADLAASMKLDWGSGVHTTTVADLVGLALTVRDPQAGWQYAHWLVAHAEDQGVKRVRFAGLEWTATSGAWAHVTDGAGGAASGQVLAEVFGA